MPDKLSTVQINEFARQCETVAVVEIGVGQIRAEDRRIVARGRAEQERGFAVQAPGKPRDDARIFAIESLGRGCVLVTAKLAAKIAAAVEDHERVAALERVGLPLGERLRRGDVEAEFQLAHAEPLQATTRASPADRERDPIASYSAT